LLSYRGYIFPCDLPLLVSVFFLLPYYTVLLKIYPLGRISSACRRNIPASETRKCFNHGEEETLNKIYRTATFFSTHLWRSDRPCLRRTLIMHRWCCCRGIDSLVIVGVQKENRELKSHAWLAIGGKPFKETAEQLSKYTSILES
jgi:hypothetical protein